ncbi:hypothetical protein [Nonomuraea sp. NPDC048901]
MASQSAPIEHPAHKPFWRRPFRVIRENMRAYIVINAAAYGLAIIGFVIGLVFPDLSAARSASLEEDGTGELVRWLVNTRRFSRSRSSGSTSSGSVR